MLCAFCKTNNYLSCINSKYSIWKCELCRAHFISKNNNITYLFLYYKNFRLCFYSSLPYINEKEVNPICFLQIASTPFCWEFICDMNPNIVELPIKKIHKKIDAINSLLIFL